MSRIQPTWRNGRASDSSHFMLRTFLAAAGLALLGLLATAAAAQTAQPSFDLVVRAPDPLRQLLENNLELRRYREVSDLDDSEVARLVVLGEKDARELLATQGYFSPEVSITRETGPPTRLVVAVEPGPRTQVRAVDIAFEGDIATTTDPAAVA